MAKMLLKRILQSDDDAGMMIDDGDDDGGSLLMMDGANSNVCQWATVSVLLGSR